MPVAGASRRRRTQLARTWQEKKAKNRIEKPPGRVRSGGVTMGG
jgi:hypothetical protein